MRLSIIPTAYADVFVLSILPSARHAAGWDESLRADNVAMPNYYPDPVIFVAGIKGSALRDEYPVDPETVWSVLRAVVKSYDRITLHPYNPRYEAQEPARVVRDQVFGRQSQESA